MRGAVAFSWGGAKGSPIALRYGGLTREVLACPLKTTIIIRINSQAGDARK
jgi:hypothetical protein